MTLSVAMAVYNGGYYLSEQLDSIARQFRLPDELVISDNGSTDGSVSIITDFARTAPFPVQLHLQATNVGVGQNFARAICLCRGDVICLADCDDVWYPMKLRRIDELFSMTPSLGLIFSDADLVNEHLTPIGYSLHESFACAKDGLTIVRAGRDAIRILLCDRSAVFGNTMSFRGAFKSQCLPMPSVSALYKGFHDIWIAILIASGADIGITSERLLAYRQHKGQWGGTPLKTSLSTRLRRLVEPCDPRAAVVARLLVDRLSSMNVREKAVADAFTIVEAWSRHLWAREEIPTERLKRLPLIWREIVTGQYSTFSGGLMSAAKDFFKHVDHRPRQVSSQSAHSLVSSQVRRE